MKSLYSAVSAYTPRMKTDRFFVNPSCETRLTGLNAAMNEYVQREQLLRADVWRRFVEQFRVRADDTNAGWRGEYWGKMMRGGAFVFGCTRDAALYQALTDTVRDMLTTQDELGRISSYSVSCEFDGWDLWSRKYVLLGMQYYFEICSDEALKAELIASMRRQADYIVEKIGDGPGRKSITAASRHWRGLNSSSLLEPIVRLYTLTKEQKYLEFAAYIVKAGFTQVENLWALALADELKPYQYPITKAYEMMSCFEGLLEFYRITGIEDYKKAVVNFANRVLETDFTIIGSCGCTHELFDHSTVRQANTTNGITAQETCVTVTLMKFFSQLTLLTGNAKYMDAVERSGYNAYFGAFNTAHALCRSMAADHPDWVHEPLPFDSYSPLTAGTRGNHIGGLQAMAGGHYYGCCACIASAGAGLMGRMACLNSRRGLVLNLYPAGQFSTQTPSGSPVTLSVDTDYPRQGTISVRLNLSRPETFDLALRVPAWSKRTSLLVNGEPQPVKTGYVTLRRLWQSGDTLSLSLDMRTEALHPIAYHHDVLMNKVIWEYNLSVPRYDREDPLAKHHFALRRGPLILAQDARLGYDLSAPADILTDADGYVAVEPLASAPYDHLVAFSVPCAGGSSLPVTDYASAGKTWTEESKTAAWILGNTVPQIK